MTSYLALTSEQVKKAVAAAKKSKPVYTEILDFYGGVFEAQEDCKSRIDLEPLRLSEDLRTARVREKLALIEIKEFVYDETESTNLFMTICELSKNSNPKKGMSTRPFRSVKISSSLLTKPTAVSMDLRRRKLILRMKRGT